MSTRSSRAGSEEEVPDLQPARLVRTERRDLLLDAAASLVEGGDTDAVSMDAVAEAAGVSRALVYKHFANRRELLSALYQRESALLHAQLSDAVGRTASLEEMLRALIEGALDAQASRAATFVALATGGGRPRSQRDVQQRRDRQTLVYFSRQAETELGLDEATARAALGMALSTIPAVLAQWRRRPTAENAALLADTYVSMTMGGLRALAGREG